MKWENMRQSRNVEDRRGQTPRGPVPSGMGMGRGGGINPGILFLLLRSRVGRWVLILGVLFMLFGGGLGGLLGGNTGPVNVPQNTPNAQVETHQVPQQSAYDEDAAFVSAVLASTEDVWDEIFKEHGQTYVPPKLVLYTGAVQTQGCGFASSAVGPFYCPGDEKVYIDLDFYDELQTKFQAPGDFAMAYVIAHEVGHHIQNISGIMGDYNRARQSMSETQANELNVRLELQADYFAGVWARHVDEAGYLDVGDLDEALQAASAVGDDTLQEQAYGRVVPDSFTHGTSAQRQNWFKRGYEYADLEHGDTFNQPID